MDRFGVSPSPRPGSESRGASTAAESYLAVLGFSFDYLYRSSGLRRREGTQDCATSPLSKNAVTPVRAMPGGWPDPQLLLEESDIMPSAARPGSSQFTYLYNSYRNALGLKQIVHGGPFAPPCIPSERFSRPSSREVVNQGPSRGITPISIRRNREKIRQQNQLILQQQPFEDEVTLPHVGAASSPGGEEERRIPCFSMHNGRGSPTSQEGALGIEPSLLGAHSQNTNSTLKVVISPKQPIEDGAAVASEGAEKLAAATNNRDRALY